MTEEQQDHRLVFGERHGFLQIGALADIERIVAATADLDVLLSCRTWAQVREASATEELYEERFAGYLDELWRETGPRGLPARPRGWAPDHEVDLTDWSSDQPRVDDPECLTLPAEVLALARREGSMTSGDFIHWDLEALAELRDVAGSLGLALEERQDLFDAAAG